MREKEIPATEVLRDEFKAVETLGDRLLPDTVVDWKSLESSSQLLTDKTRFLTTRLREVASEIVKDALFLKHFRKEFETFFKGHVRGELPTPSSRRGHLCENISKTSASLFSNPDVQAFLQVVKNELEADKSPVKSRFVPGKPKSLSLLPDSLPEPYFSEETDFYLILRTAHKALDDALQRIKTASTQANDLNSARTLAQEIQACRQELAVSALEAVA